MRRKHQLLDAQLYTKDAVICDKRQTKIQRYEQRNIFHETQTSEKLLYYYVNKIKSLLRSSKPYINTITKVLLLTWINFFLLHKIERSSKRKVRTTSERMNFFQYDDIVICYSLTVEYFHLLNRSCWLDCNKQKNVVEKYTNNMTRRNTWSR